MTKEFGCIVTWMPVDTASDQVCQLTEDSTQRERVISRYKFLVRGIKGAAYNLHIVIQPINAISELERTSDNVLKTLLSDRSIPGAAFYQQL